MMNRQPVATASSYYTHAYAPSQQQAHGHYHDPAAAYVSVGYRPLQLPLQQHQQLQHQGAEQQLAASSFHTPNFRPHQLPQQQTVVQQALPVRTRAQLRHQRQQQQQIMAYQEQNADELAELQKLSNEYQPEVTVRVFLTFWAPK
jgi:hypothetical protein